MCSKGGGLSTPSPQGYRERHVEGDHPYTTVRLDWVILMKQMALHEVKPAVWQWLWLGYAMKIKHRSAGNDTQPSCGR